MLCLSERLYLMSLAVGGGGGGGGSKISSDSQTETIAAFVYVTSCFMLAIQSLQNGIFTLQG